MNDLSGLPDQPTASPRVKICGLTRRQDALHAAEAGADYLGVVLVPESPRSRTPEQAGEILAGHGVPGVIVVADLAPDEMASAASKAGADVIQLHGRETPEVVSRLRDLGSWQVWKALTVRAPEDVMEGVARFGGVVQGILLDAWDPHRRGGTGRAFSWSDVSRAGVRFPSHVTRIAAGGLTPMNVEDAVEILRPDVVDVSSGVERSPGIKAPEKIEAFVRRVRRPGRESSR
jgi:phosphoribosylanthranilate isomerase